MRQASSEIQGYYSGDGARISKIEHQMSVMSRLFSTWETYKPTATKTHYEGRTIQPSTLSFF